jgi:hypothetical protein
LAFAKASAFGSVLGTDLWYQQNYFNIKTRAPFIEHLQMEIVFVLIYF